MFKNRMLIAIVISLMVLPVFAPTAWADITVDPTDDTYVDRNDPGTNKDIGRLRTDYSNLPGWVITRRTYLRFHLGSVVGDLTDARVRLFTQRAPLSTQNGILAIWSTEDDWNGSDAGNGDETTLIWNNAPPLISQLATTPAATTDNTWIEFTGSALTAHINSQRAEMGGDDIVSLVVQWDSCGTCALSDSTTFENREGTGGTTNYPQLVLTGPTAVTLSRFEAWPIATGMHVQWETVEEVDTLGFNLYRSTTLEGSRVKLNRSLIPAKSLGSPIGAVYDWNDIFWLVRPRTLFYWLEDVDIHGYTTMHGPAKLRPSLSTGK